MSNFNDKPRHQQVAIACRDEITRFNAVVTRKWNEGDPILYPEGNSLCAGQPIRHMSHDFWLTTGNASDTYFCSRWCMCNDGRWAQLLKLAGVTRHPLFADHA